MFHLQPISQNLKLFNKNRSNNCWFYNLASTTLNFRRTLALLGRLSIEHLKSQLQCSMVNESQIKIMPKRIP